MRLKIFAALLAFSTAMTPVQAHAGIVEGIVALVSTIANAVGVSVVGQALIGQAIFTLAGSALGTALISAAFSFALNALFAPDVPQPTPSETQANFLLEEAPRFWISGRQRQGGSILFGETKEGAIYKLVAHGDCEFTTISQYYLNDVPVTVDELGRVTENEYKAGGGFKYFIESRSGERDQVAMTTLVDDFPEWTANHKGAGVCDTLLSISPIADKYKAKLLKHAGVLRAGEPDVTLDAWYGRYYDPRNDSTNGGSGSERVDDYSTWGPALGNAVLTIVQHRMDIERFANDPADINWSNIIEQANICDELVTDRYGQSAPRYRLGITVNKKTERNIDAENRMLAACDGIRWQDDDGKLGFYVGQYDSDPALVLTDSDIFEIESRDGEDGENLFTHYFAQYTEPAFGMKGTQSGAYEIDGFNPATDDPKTTEIPLYPIQNHNQAIRVLRAGVLRQHEKLRVGLVCGLRGLKAKRHRFLRLDTSDTVLAGIYEIAGVTDSYDGLRVQITLIRCDEDRWNLGVGDEPQRPNLSIEVTDDGDIENIADEDMVISADGIQVETGSAVRLTAVFTPPARSDVIVQIQHRLDGGTIWEEFGVRTEDGAGVSGVVPSGQIQEVRWRTTTLSGRESGWSDILEINAVADQTPPADLGSPGVSFGTGEATASWVAPASTNYGATRIYRADGLAASFGSSTLIRTEYGFPSQTDEYTDTVAAGDYSYWLEPINKSDVPGTVEGPFTGTVT